MMVMQRLTGPQAVGFPAIKLWWIRSRDPAFIHFRKPVAYLGVGQKESGKSALLETVAVHYPKIIDLFGSRDSEGLAWCRSPFKDSVLFIVGDTIDVKSQWDSVRISDLTLRHLTKYKVILSVSAFHPSVDTEFYAMNEIIKVLYRRTWWKEPWFVMVREASNFLYSRLKVSKNQTEAKADFLYLLREARHMGYAVGVDTIRWTGVDADMRGPCDYVFVKRVGIEGLPDDLRWLYGLVRPRSLMNPHPRAFVLVSNRGPVAFGTFDEPYWHKREKENIVQLLDIRIEYGEAPDYGDQSRNTVSDFEHIKLVGTYMRVGSMKKVAKMFSRSPATVNTHIKDHDEDVGRLGYCPKCKRVQGPHARILLRKSKGKIVYDTITSWKEFEKTGIPD